MAKDFFRNLQCCGFSWGSCTISIEEVVGYNRNMLVAIRFAGNRCDNMNTKRQVVIVRVREKVKYFVCA